MESRAFDRIMGTIEEYDLTPEEECELAWAVVKATFKKHDAPITMRLYDGDHEISVWPYVTDQDGYGVLVAEGTCAAAGEVVVSIGTKEMMRILPKLVEATAIAAAQRLRRSDQKLHSVEEEKISE